MSPRPCPHCGACLVPPVGPGSGPRLLASARCRACCAFLPGLPRALVVGQEGPGAGE